MITYLARMRDNFCEIPDCKHQDTFVQSRALVQDVTAEPVKAKKKRKPKAKTDIRADNDSAQKVSDAAALAREEAMRKVEEEQQALRAARAKQRELEEELLEKRKQVRF